MRVLRGEAVPDTLDVNVNGKRKSKESSSRAQKQVSRLSHIIAIHMLMSCEPRTVSQIVIEAEVEANVYSSSAEGGGSSCIDHETDADGGPPASSEVDDDDVHSESSDKDEAQVAAQYDVLKDMTATDQNVSVCCLHQGATR
jgi:hypothetical protein